MRQHLGEKNQVLGTYFDASAKHCAKSSIESDKMALKSKRSTKFILESLR
jgi:hypothetical protein